MIRIFVGFLTVTRTMLCAGRLGGPCQNSGHGLTVPQDDLPDRPCVRRSARRRIPAPGLPRGGGMRAIVQDVYGSAGVLKLRDIGRPSIDEGEGLVRGGAAGVDPGGWHPSAGEPYLVRAMGFGLRKPKVA